MKVKALIAVWWAYNSIYILQNSLLLKYANHIFHFRQKTNSGTYGTTKKIIDIYICTISRIVCFLSASHTFFLPTIIRRSYAFSVCSAKWIYAKCAFVFLLQWITCSRPNNTSEFNAKCDHTKMDVEKRVPSGKLSTDCCLVNISFFDLNCLFGKRSRVLRSHQRNKLKCG